ncbi:MAG: DNA topoisomerase (ATP-hydrolyzing) subunit B [Candidatus Portnoybacteria bacterium]|nr:DNA topoisomerase (ATP-hydrolyzing) subunit B [Candidatus Portnoybacteria bacterium]MDD4982910.1 DNA topoisomerase (ATP-hydrolyzing) subunit B [Candidatus Portnoybacteria bacterium]
MAKNNGQNGKNGNGGDGGDGNVANASYEAKDIYVLEGLDPVRKRPGMYIGSTGIDGVHHLVWEVVDNSLDEAMAGFASEIEVSFLPQNRVRVKDNGRGIPVDIHKQTKKSALETVLCTLHAGGKFGGESYKISGGLHGVGVSVVNALSIWLRAEVCRDGSLYVQEYSKGKPKHSVKKVGKCDAQGTTIYFEPDPEIFKDIRFNRDTIIGHLRQQAYLVKGTKIIIRDLRQVNKKAEEFFGVCQVAGKKKIIMEERGPDKGERSYGFFIEGGIVSYVKFLNNDNEVRHTNIFYVNREEEGLQVEVAFQYTDDLQGYEMSFANNIYTIEGGMHLTGFRTALTRGLNDYARKNNFLKSSDENLTGDDVREGITAVISVKLREPQFEGQTKAKLGNPEARTAVDTVVAYGLEEYLEKNPNDAKEILGTCILASKARQAAKAAKDTVLRKGILEGLALPGKLADCSSRKPEESELFIVEGDSAGGSAKQGRDRKFQAILPLRGKILNVEKARLDKALTSKEVKALIIALGTAIADSFDISKLRYHRIVIMTDADVDGAHIRTLLLTLFFRYFQPLIDAGNIYIAQPPLFRVAKGKDVRYAYDEAERDKLIGEFKKLKADKAAAKAAAKGGKVAKEEAEESESEVMEDEEKISGVSVQRYKGLGEMNPGQLWETTMDPARRMLKQVNIADAKEADKVFDILMGDEVAPRKRFIQTHAKNVVNLDI